MDIHYKMYTKNEEMLIEFHSDWRFKIGEKISIELEYKKKNF